jgi:hypothetical protein
MMETDMSVKSTRVSGWKCRSFVQDCIPFHNSNKQLFGEQRGELYVVYSYGYHWPMYANWKGIWFRNTEKFSRTTTKHDSQTNPLVPTVPLSKLDLEFLVLFGKPDGNALLGAAKLKLVPEHLIPEVTAIRVGAAA